MAKLPKFTLEYDERKEKWALENDKTNRTIKTFTTKEGATAGGVLICSAILSTTECLNFRESQATGLGAVTNQ